MSDYAKLPAQLRALECNELMQRFPLAVFVITEAADAITALIADRDALEQDIIGHQKIHDTLVAERDAFCTKLCELAGKHLAERDALLAALRLAVRGITNARRPEWDESETLAICVAAMHKAEGRTA